MPAKSHHCTVYCVIKGWWKAATLDCRYTVFVYSFSPGFMWIDFWLRPLTKLFMCQLTLFHRISSVTLIKLFIFVLKKDLGSDNRTKPGTKPDTKPDFVLDLQPSLMHLHFLSYDLFVLCPKNCFHKTNPTDDDSLTSYAINFVSVPFQSNIW